MNTKMMLFILLFVTGCKWLPLDTHQLDVFKASMRTYLLETHIVEASKKEYVNSDKYVERPFYTEQALLHFKKHVGRETVSGLENYCLTYLIPLKGKEGKLTFSKLEDGRFSCDQEDKRLELVSLDGVKELKIFFSSKQVNMKKRRNSVDPYELSIFFTHHKRRVLFKMPLFNVDANSFFIEGQPIKANSYKNERFRASNKNSYLDGSKLVTNTEKFEGTKEYFQGELLDLYGDKKTVKCRDVSKKCSIVGEDTCSHCRYGWYEVIDHDCPMGGSRFCGSDRCGERGMPACPRGKKVVVNDNKKAAICYDGSPHGFCQVGLKTVCDGNGVLVCL